MGKHPAISFFLLLAFVMLQAHNLIPHFHIDSHSGNNSHTHAHSHDQDKPHDHDDHDEGQNRNEEHDSPFQTASHNADFGKTVIRPEQHIGETSNWHSLSIKLSPILDYLFCPEGPPPKSPLAKNQFPPDTYFYPSLFLRGPPAIVS